MSGGLGLGGSGVSELRAHMPRLEALASSSRLLFGI